MEPPSDSANVDAGGGVSVISRLEKEVSGTTQHSVIQETPQMPLLTHQADQQQQLDQRGTSDPTIAALEHEEDPEKRRELLARRPSYRKILNELSGSADEVLPKQERQQQEIQQPPPPAQMISPVQHHQARDVRQLPPPGPAFSLSLLNAAAGGEIGIKTEDGRIVPLDPNLVKHEVLPSLLNKDTFPAALLSAKSHVQLPPFFSAAAAGQCTEVPLAVTNTTGLAAGGATILQYAQGPDGQIYVPGANQVYQLANQVSLPQGVVIPNSNLTPPSQQPSDEASKKRELRLLKNREAAKECRRKKKEYVKCLESRVAVLEAQNKQLIDELKSLKELYCKKDVNIAPMNQG